MKTHEQITYATVENAIRNVLCDNDKLGPRTMLIEDLGADSLALFELARELESNLERDVELEEAMQWVLSRRKCGPRDMSIQEVVDYLLETHHGRWRETA